MYVCIHAYKPWEFKERKLCSDVLLHLPLQQVLKYLSVPGHDTEIGMCDKAKPMQHSGFTDLAYGLNGCHPTDNIKNQCLELQCLNTIMSLENPNGLC